MFSSKKLVSLVAKAFPDAVFYKDIEENQTKILALTIDDVPARDDNSDISTQNILNVIDEHNTQTGDNAKATFFITTSHLNSNSSILEDMIAKDHELGNHGTIDHRHSNLPAQQFEDEFIEAHERLILTPNATIRWFRPGQAFYNENMLETLKTKGKEFGYEGKFALASMIPFDTRDFLDDPQFTLKNINRFTFSGSILLLHGGKKEQASNTVQVLKELLPQLHKQGYKIVTLSQLFS